MKIISNIFSTCALLFYSLIYIPQFYIIYKTHDSSGINLTMMCILCQLDYAALISTLLTWQLKDLLIIYQNHILVRK
jgi:uncharacterized protein with PQ loop repeat